MNIREYTDREMTLVVTNDEGLYNYMIEMIDNGHSASFIAATLSEGFNHTDGQFDDLLDTVKSEIEERNV